MPTVPRYGDRKVLSEPMPGPRVTVSADAETFGGGASSKEIATAAEGLNTTIQNRIAKQNALNSGVKTNKLIGSAVNEMLASHFDATEGEYDVNDPITKEPKKIKMPNGILLANGEYASVGGGSQKRSFEATNGIVEKYLSMMDSPDEADRFLKGVASTATSLNDRAGSHEISQKKAYYDKETDASLQVIASNPILPPSEKVRQIAEGAYKNVALAGEPKSVADEKITKAALDSYMNTLDGMLNSGSATDKDVNALIKEASKNRVDESGVYKLRQKAEDKDIQLKLEQNSRWKTKAEDTLRVGIQKAPWYDGNGMKEIPQTGDPELRTYISKINKNRKTVWGTNTSDQETLNKLLLGMADDSFSDKEKYTEIYKATADGKLSRSDWKPVTDVYFMEPDQKKVANQGLKSIDEYVTQDLGNNPTQKSWLINDFIERVKTSKRGDKEAESDFSHRLYTDSLHAFNLKEKMYPASTKKEDAAQRSGKIVGGTGFVHQGTGMASTPKKKPDATLSPKTDRVTIVAPNGEEQSVPKAKLQYYLDKGGKLKNG